MKKYLYLACCFLISAIISSHAEKIGTSPSLLVMQGGIGMQIDVENVEKDVPFNAFVDWIGNIAYSTQESFQGSLALALVGANGDLKEIIEEVTDIQLDPGWGYGQYHRFYNVKVTTDFEDTDIIRFITKQRNSSEWLPVNSKECTYSYCNVKDNIVHKSNVEITTLGHNEIPCTSYCEGTWGDSYQTEPIYSSAYTIRIKWPEGKDHHFFKVEPMDDRVQIDPDRILFQIVEHPEYHVTLMACSDEELVMEQKFIDVSEPGSLSAILRNDPHLLYYNNISISGQIDASDIYFIRDEMPMVEHIDLSQSEIVGGRLPNRAFEEKGIKTLILPDNLLGFGYNSLRKTKLHQITIPEDVCFFDLNTFNYSEDLTVIVLKNPSVIPVSWCVLEGTNRANGVLFVPKGTRQDFAEDSQWGRFSQIVEGDNADDYVIESDEIYKYSGVYPEVTVTQVLRPSDKMIVPETVELNGRTFSVTGIGSNVFSSYDINEIFIPASVTTMGEYAIESYYCSQLRSIDVDAANPAYFSDGGVLYDRARSAMLTYPPSKVENEYAVPEGIKEISGWACYARNLHKVILPSTVSVIGSCAFSYSSGLKTKAEIVCKAVTPPSLNNTSFANETFINADVYVPAASVDIYKSDPRWSNFYNIYPMRDEDGVVDVEIDERWIYISGNTLNLNGDDCIEIYGIDGRSIFRGLNGTVELPDGLYIIKYKNLVKKIKI